MNYKTTKYTRCAINKCSSCIFSCVFVALQHADASNQWDLQTFRHLIIKNYLRFIILLFRGNKFLKKFHLDSYLIDSWILRPFIFQRCSQTIDICSTYTQIYCKTVIGHVHLDFREQLSRRSKHPTQPRIRGAKIGQKLMGYM